MSAHTLPYAVNCSILFTELPLLERAAAAKAAGFDAVEFWWPFADPVPGDDEVELFVRSVQDAGTRLVALNFYGGHSGEPGILSIPGRAREFRDNIPAAVEIGARLGAVGFNALYGARLQGDLAKEQHDLATESLVLAARAAGEIGACVLVEPLSASRGTPLLTAADAAAVVGRVREAGGPAIGILCDLYHLGVNGDDIDAAIDRYTPVIAHVQIADHPGRGEPGTGKLDLDRYLAALQGQGYSGWVSLEYQPTTSTLGSLAWLPPERRRSSRQD
ncbi:MAG: TIM barrel protein [Acidimicrobiaceae bacterium]|nr:TIM barrel protein [Acidimicrobiaceae bacterium]